MSRPEPIPVDPGNSCPKIEILNILEKIGVEDWGRGFFFILFVSYFEMIELIFSHFECNGSFLEDYPWIPCNESIIITIISIGAVIIMFGYPAIFIALLVNARDPRKRPSLRWIQMSIAGYSDTFYFWDVCILFRAVIVKAIDSFVTEEFHFFSYSILLLLWIFAVAFLQPFQTEGLTYV